MKFLVLAADAQLGAGAES